MTYPFDHAIRHPLPHTQPPPQAADSLVVVAVDPRRGTHQLRQFTHRPCIMQNIARLDLVSRHTCIQCPAEKHVQRLHSPADTQNRLFRRRIGPDRPDLILRQPIRDIPTAGKQQRSARAGRLAPYHRRQVHCSQRFHVVYII